MMTLLQLHEAKRLDDLLRAIHFITPKGDAVGWAVRITLIQGSAEETKEIYDGTVLNAYREFIEAQGEVVYARLKALGVDVYT